MTIKLSLIILNVFIYSYLILQIIKLWNTRKLIFYITDGY